MLTKYSFLVNASKTTSMNGMAKIWTGQLMYNILSQVITTNVSLVITTWQMHPSLFNTSTLLTSLLSKQEHIASLEWELLQLHNRKANPLTCPNSQSNRKSNINIANNWQLLYSPIFTDHIPLIMLDAQIPVEHFPIHRNQFCEKSSVS